MDTFTESILTRARERQKLLKDISNNTNVDEGVATNQEHEASPKLRNSNSQSHSKYNDIERKNSPSQKIQTMNIQKENLNMEITVTSSDNIRVQVEIEEEVEDEETNNIGIRKNAKDRLNRLGKLYAGDGEISSPIHKTEEKFSIEEPKKPGKKKSPGKGLRGLADLAKNMNKWEDDFRPAKDIEFKEPIKKCDTNKGTNKQKQVSLQEVPKNVPLRPSMVSSRPISDKIKKWNNSASPEKKMQSEMNKPSKLITKSLQWDKTVLDSLESQGFHRRSKDASLVFDCEVSEESKNVNTNKQFEGAEKHYVSTQKSFLSPKKQLETPQTSFLSPKKQLESPQKSFGSPKKYFDSPKKQIDSPKILFASPKKQVESAKFQCKDLSDNQLKSSGKVDPSSLPLSERRALFEKNKGKPILPTPPFKLIEPNIASEKTLVKDNIVTRVVDKSTKIIEKQDKNSPNDKNNTTPVTIQSKGIATTVASLLEKKQTISQSQIQNEIAEQRKKEMDLLLNRYKQHKNKELSFDEKVTLNDDSEENNEPDYSPNKPKHSSIGSKRHSVSPKVAAVLENVKRVKVSPAKPGKLYPNLSDIEAGTETNSEDAQSTSCSTNDEENNSSFDSNDDVEDPDTSFGRDLIEVINKNQTPKKREVDENNSGSDCSNISDVIGDMDEYLEEFDTEEEEHEGPTPSKQMKNKKDCSKSSNSFNYKSFSTPVAKSPDKNLPTHVLDGASMLPLAHTVSFYRKQQQTSSTVTPTKKQKQHSHEDSTSSKEDDQKVILEKITNLQSSLHNQQMIISQTSQALNLCNNTLEFMGSIEQVEAEKVLLLSTHRRQAILNEIQRLKVEGTLRPQNTYSELSIPLEKGSLTISNVMLPLKKEYVRALAAAGGKGHHVTCLVKCGEEVVCSKLVSTVASDIKNPICELYIPGNIVLKNIYSNFAVTFEVYCLQAQEEILSHDIKYHIKKNKCTPKKHKQDSSLLLSRGVKESPGGPQAVRSPSFACMGYVIFSIGQINKKTWSLNNTPSMSPLEGSVEMSISCELTSSVEFRGFLTVFEDISGFGAWHRRWCLLRENTLTFWKYPDDERKIEPINTIDLRNSITKEVKPVTRDICARLHTFLIETVRDPLPQDKDTLVMICEKDRTVIRHLLSADTKEDRVIWGQKLNSAITALKLWGKI